MSNQIILLDLAMTLQRKGAGPFKVHLHYIHSQCLLGILLFRKHLRKMNMHLCILFHIKCTYYIYYTHIKCISSTTLVIKVVIYMIFLNMFNIEISWIARKFIELFEINTNVS